MKKALKLTREGFTLVELMIVVAIIGILATIAIPQYNKFISKSKQSEAKVSLGGIRTAEASFTSENNSYSSCLSSIGFARDGKKFYYTVGFSSTVAAKSLCGPTGDAACNSASFGTTVSTGTGTATSMSTATNGCTAGKDVSSFEANTAATLGGLPNTGSLDKLPNSKVTAVSKGNFIAAAIGNLSTSASNSNTDLTGDDIWLVDQDNTLQNLQLGL